MKSVLLLPFLSACILLAGTAAWGALPATEPLLRIETGMHTALIKGISTDAAGRWLATASDDKTARVWESATGRLVQVLRPPADKGHEGKLFAVAMSPDGTTVACGGWTGWEWEGSSSVYLFDRATGGVVRRLGGFPEVIKGLSFSPDGASLAVTLGGRRGLMVVASATGKALFADRAYGDDSYGVAFDRSGRLVTTSWDGLIRLYDRQFRRIATYRTAEGVRPHGVAFSPDGTLVAVGNTDGTRVEVLSGEDLAFLFAPAAGAGGDGALFSVAWSPDGKRLYAGGSSSAAGTYLVRSWPDGGKGAVSDLRVAEGNIMGLASLADGSVAFAGALPELGVIGPSGAILHRQGPSIVDYRGGQPDFRVSADGGTIQFGYGAAGTARARFSPADRFLVTDPPLTGAGLTLPLISGGSMAVEGWLNGKRPLLNGRPLHLEKNETSRSLALFPDGRGFVLGTDWHVRCFDPQGKEQWRRTTPGIAWGVNVPASGRVVVACFGDGTIRWYRLSDGQELLAFFPHADRRRWLLWTPSGYYDAAPGGEELIGWHLNNGGDRAADFFPVSRFRRVYYRPDVVGRVLGALDEVAALRAAGDAGSRKPETDRVASLLPPVVTILAPGEGAVVGGNDVSVRFTVRSRSGAPVTGVRVLVEGRPAVLLAQEKVTAGPESPQEVRVPLPEGSCTVSVIAENRHAASEPATVRVVGKSMVARQEFSLQPKLYVLAVGVGAYRDKDLALNFAAKDARDFAALMAEQKGGLYRDVAVRVITDEEAGRDAILEGLEWLQRQTTSRDVAVLFMSGHGVTDPNGVYYYLPVGADREKLKSTAVIFTEIRNTLTALAGKTVLFIDTCHAGDIMGKRRGSADVNALVNELTSAENGVVVFASSTGRQYSLEDPNWGNGAFTKALVEGIGGKADYTGKGKITINMLDLWLSERVKELTGGKQTPVSSKPQTIQDFPLAVKK